MHRAWLALAVLVAVAAPARADVYADNFAIFARLDRSAVVDTATFELPRTSNYAYLLVGTYKRLERVEQRAFLVRCGRKECFGTSLWLGAGKIEVLGAIDLVGAAVPFPDRSIHVRKFDKVSIGTPKMKWPVLLVRTTEASTMSTTDRVGRPVTGTNRHSSLKMISLLRKDEKAPRVFEDQVVGQGPTGAGFYTTITFEKGEGKTLEIVTSYQRTVDRSLACLPPPPIKTRYRLGKDRRYTADSGAPGMSGCSG